MAETAGEIKPYDPTLRERLAAGLQAGLEKMGTDRYKARQRAQTVMGGPSSNLPMGLGLTDVAASVSAPAALAVSPLYASEGVRDIKEAGESAKRGDYVGAGVDLAFGAMNVAPFVSGVTNLAQRALRRPMQPMEVPDIPLLPENLPKRQRRHPRGLSEPEAEAERIRAVERVKGLLGEQRMAGGGAMKPLKEKVKKTVRDAIEILSPIESEANRAKLLAQSQVKDRMYHGTSHDIERFEPKGGEPVFLSPDPNFASKFALDDMLYGASSSATGWVKPGANVMPVYARVSNPFDYENPKHIRSVLSNLDPRDRKAFKEGAARGSWQEIERHLGSIQDSGFDSVFVSEMGTKNLAVFDPNKIKSAIGNRGTYDTRESDITKRQGGLAAIQRRP